MNRNSILWQYSAAEFAKWELHLYLDTHPCDVKAKELFDEYAMKAEKLKNEYERLYGALTPDRANGNSWTKAPWPWQNCGGEN